MLNPVKPSDFTKIARLFSDYEDGYARGRKNRVREDLPKLSNEAKEFLAFLHHFFSSNRMWKTLEPDQYVAVLPARQNSMVVVEEFVELLRYYGARRPAEHNEKVLIRFLNKLTRSVQNFFLEVLARNKVYAEIFHITEVREELAQYPIDADALYSGTSMLKTEHGGVLQYPVVSVAVPAGPLVPVLLYKDLDRIRLRILPTKHYPNTSGYERNIPRKWLGVDAYNIQDAKVVLYGLADIAGHSFYPLDYFSDLKEYKRYQKDTLKGINERQLRLTTFLERNYLVCIKRTTRTVCHSDKEVPLAIGRVLKGSGQVVHFCDFRHKHHHVVPETREGVIGGIWKRGEVSVGFEVWSNARMIPAYFDFTGVNNGLLYNPRAVRYRHAMFHLFEVDGLQAAAVSEIQWERRPYKKTPVILSDGSIGYLERCPYCLQQTSRPHASGLCDWTVANFRYTLGAKGVDTWFKVPKGLLARRAEKHFEPEVFERLIIGYKHYRLECNKETGEMMFRYDPHMEALFNMQNKDSTTPEELKEWFQKYHVTKGDK